ncbi:MAG: phosphotransferase [Candidatus Promineofilum sp.]|nr:phosphotransferase [Promineifilum sp.]
MTPIRIARSFISAASVAEIVAAEYDCPPPVSAKLFSKLLRTQDNDHYLVTAGDGQQYAFRLYQQGDRFRKVESDYLYEMDWLNFLKGHELPVSYPIRRRDGGHVGRLDAPEGPRYYALFSLAYGDPMSLKDPEQLYTMGETMARIHVISNDFTTPHARKAIDLTYLLDRPLERINRTWTDDRVANLDLVTAAAEEARDELAGLLEHFPTDGWGPIGGDFHQSSVFFDETDRPTFFNFDLCGPGWRAYDVAAFLSNGNLMHAPAERAEAFFAGYFSVRPLTDKEHAAVGPFLTIRRVWLMGAFAREDGLVGHTFVGSI